MWAPSAIASCLHVTCTLHGFLHCSNACYRPLCLVLSDVSKLLLQKLDMIYLATVNIGDGTLRKVNCKYSLYNFTQHKDTFQEQPFVLSIWFSWGRRERPTEITKHAIRRAGLSDCFRNMAEQDGDYASRTLAIWMYKRNQNKPNWIFFFFRSNCTLVQIICK